MADRRPLVLGPDGLPQQLQSPEDLDIPLEERHTRLLERFDKLVLWLAMTGFDLPPDILE